MYRLYCLSLFIIDLLIYDVSKCHFRFFHTFKVYICFFVIHEFIILILTPQIILSSPYKILYHKSKILH